jgi:hypothetical protein
MARTVELSRGLVAVVDDDDYERVAALNWYASPARGTSQPYARSNMSPDRATRGIDMQRFIMCASPGQVVDHRDGDTLNNQRSNLRITNFFGNSRNRRSKNMRNGGFKGVYPAKSGSRWRAKIVVCSRQLYLGTFGDPVVAARAYDSAALQHFGEFAALNFGGPARLDPMPPACAVTVRRLPRKTIRNSSGFLGVSKDGARWRACILRDKKIVRLGSFDTKKEAAHAYDRAARSVFGERARLNFPKEGERAA